MQKNKFKKNNQRLNSAGVFCPHCHHKFRSTSHGGHKYLGPSYRPCPKCNGMYNDIDYYEWSLLTPLYKFFFYFFANNRVFGLLPMVEFLIWECDWNACYSPAPLIILSFLWPFGCYFYIRYRYKGEMLASKLRTENNPEYVELLQLHEDPFYFRYDFHKQHLSWNDLKELIKDAFTFD